MTRPFLPLAPLAPALALALALAVTLVLALAASARADTAGMRCVEQQLGAAGQPFGNEGLALYARSHGLAPGLALHNATATTWCRRIGLADPAMRRYWPAGQQPLEVILVGALEPALVEAIRTRAPLLHEAAAALLGLELAGTDRLIIGDDRAALAAAMAEQGLLSEAGIDDALERHCSGRAPVGAFAVPGQVVACLQPGIRLGSALSHRQLDFVLAHEFTHLVQFQVAGVSLDRDPQARISREGPMWMIEGMANVAGNALAARPGQAAASVPILRRERLRRFEGRSLPLLEALAPRSALEPYEREVYGLGSIAMSFLIEENGGFEAAGRMLALMGDGTAFEPAFRAAFGKPVASFYEAFTTRLFLRLNAAPSGVARAADAGDAG